MKKQRQIVFKRYQSVQLLVTAINAVAGHDVYDTNCGVIHSPAGSWADTFYVVTNAPMAIVRKAMKMYDLTSLNVKLGDN